MCCGTDVSARGTPQSRPAHIAQIIYRSPLRASPRRLSHASAAVPHWLRCNGAVRVDFRALLRTRVPLCRAFQMQTWQLRGAVHTVGCPLECDARMVTQSRAATSSCLRPPANMALAPPSESGNSLNVQTLLWEYLNEDVFRESTEMYMPLWNRGPGWGAPEAEGALE